jgi:hypothetical protein
LHERPFANFEKFSGKTTALVQMSQKDLSYVIFQWSVPQRHLEVTGNPAGLFIMIMQ